MLSIKAYEVDRSEFNDIINALILKQSYDIIKDPLYRYYVDIEGTAICWIQETDCGKLKYFTHVFVDDLDMCNRGYREAIRDIPHTSKDIDYIFAYKNTQRIMRMIEKG